MADVKPAETAETAFEDFVRWASGVGSCSTKGRAAQSLLGG
jgi:hypothetical protein